MNKLLSYFCCLTFFLSFLFVISTTVHAQTVPSQVFVKADVVQIKKEGVKEIGGQKNIFQNLQVKILEGKDAGKTEDVDNGGDFSITQDQKVSVGETVILSQITTPEGGTKYYIYDKYRLYQILIIVALFFLMVLFIAGKKGIGSLVGLSISLVIIFSFIVPQILAGHDPLLVSIIGSIAILLLTSFLAHGFSKQTTLAVVSTFLALIFTAILSSFFVSFAKLAGLGNEEVATLQMGSTSIINLKGLLLGGIIIGTLGALNDITTTQAAAVFEIWKADKKIHVEKLYEKGFTVGKEHVVSLVNTLILAYAGTAIAVFIFLILNPGHLPYWVILNNEILSDEIVRTVGGSIGLLLSVPTVTLLCAWFVTTYEKK